MVVVDPERSFKIPCNFGDLQVHVYGELKNDLVLFHHGAGYTSATWKSLIETMSKSLKNICFASFDMRAHGQSSKCLDFDIKNLVSDALMVLNSIACNHEAIIDVFLIGHSLGAAVLSQLRDIAEEEKNKFNFAGLVMIDIIEETAINSLSRMPDIIKEIPKSFATLDDATKWTLTSSHSHHNPQAASKQIASIKDSLASQMYFNEDSNRFEWIVDLSTMQDFWNSWFDGLTKNFLKFPGSRLLVLADTDYMDREMIIAQMQGKFQLVIVRESGHAIQEDRPIELAECLVELIQKHLKLSEILRNKKLN